MLRKYFPTQYVESPFSIDYAQLVRLGYKAVLFDIDNTLVPHGAGSTPEVDALIAKVQATGLKVLMISNNSPERIESFLRNIDAPYVADADKPSAAGFQRALQILDLPKNQVVMVGDTTHTDIAGANAFGIDSILVKFVGYYTERKLGVRRRIEKAVLWAYAHSRHCNKLGDIELSIYDQGER